MGPDGVIVAITGTLVAMLLISTGFIVFIVLFHRSKRKALEQRQAAELEYLRQLGDLEHEIRDATLVQMGMELHDGVVQELTLAKLYLDKARKHTDLDEVNAAEKVLVGTIDDVRTLARSLTSKRLKDLDLVSALRAEVERLGRISGLHTRFEGDVPVKVEEREKMVMVRIAQEFFQNSLKHASAKELRASVRSRSGGIFITLEDDGRGFDPGAQIGRNGLDNMAARARSIGAAYELVSSPGAGTRLQLQLKPHG
ncbi:MAG: hypothetical protein KDB95_11105 [Flavobacteriales bacterium]|nr:hypothetical protein [Flavobacteriales bacterium]MCB9163618.1 hypothetical protein [Flavobacteriales bacterium]